MKSAHASLSGGHMGVKKTQSKVAMRAYWVWWQKEVREYCQKCDACARYHRGGVKKRRELQPMNVGTPWKRLAIDITGPHPVSNKGNKFIITVIDQFTKYAFAFPVRNHEAKTVAKYLVERVFLIHGVPLQLLSDRGAEFEGFIFQGMYELLRIDKLRTTAYKPATNGALDRMHRTLNTMLGKIVDEKQRDWDVHVSYMMTAYNTTVHSASGLTNELMYVAVEDKSMDEVRYSDFVDQQRDNFRTSFNARESLGMTAERSKKRYDMRVRLNSYKVGDWVYYFCPRHRIGRSPKWQNFYSGPFLLLLWNLPGIRIARCGQLADTEVHVDKVKTCKGEVPESWMVTKGNERPMDRMGDKILVSLFQDVKGKRDADIGNDIENNLEEKRRERPKRIAPMPSRLKRIYAAPLNVNTECEEDVYSYNNEIVDLCCRSLFQEVESFEAEGAPEIEEEVGGEQMIVAGHQFGVSLLRLPQSSGARMPVGKMRGAMRGMWLDAAPRMRVSPDREEGVGVEAAGEEGRDVAGTSGKRGGADEKGDKPRAEEEEGGDVGANEGEENEEESSPEEGPAGKQAIRGERRQNGEGGQKREWSPWTQDE